MAAEPLKPYRKGAFAVVFLLLLLLAALHLMSNAVLDSESLSRWFIPLLIFTVLGLAIMVGVIGLNLLRLLRDYRRKAAGSRLMARMVLLFGLVTMAPVGIVYFYSFQFLVRGIDSWFDVQIDNAMEDALSLDKASLDLHKRELLRFTRQLLNSLEDTSATGLGMSLIDLRITSGADELTVVDISGQVIASVNVDPEVLVSDRPDSGIIQQVRSGKNYVGLTPYGDMGELHVRCVVQDDRGMILQALYPTSEEVSRLSERVQSAYVSYKKRAYLKDSIKFSFTLTLSLVLLVALFAAAWAAFFTARRLVAPVSNIAEGTRAVAEGDYDKQLPMPKPHDELGVLVASFNAMTRRLSKARHDAEESRRELETQHAYLETVLGRLSTGVIALDNEGRLQTANPAASQILRLKLGSQLGKELEQLEQIDNLLAPFVEQVREGLQDQAPDWRREITLYRGDGRQVLLCGRSALAVEDERDQGFVIVFDDITALVKAQRDAAWGEVARRLAHEIKNPLTPIQLSAERLRRKYLHSMPAEDGQILDRATTTIVQQVDAMKAMVNAFSDYAKPSKMEAEPLLLDEFLSQVLALYEASRLKLVFEPGVPGLRLKADPVRLRQVMHNLVKNAQEAVGDNPLGKVVISTALQQESDIPYVEVVVTDNGPGFSNGELGQVFEPYVTSKEKGTGLGLAIVKKIIEEHGGSIRAENLQQGGAQIIFRLPVVFQYQHPSAAASTTDKNFMGDGQ